MSSAKSVFVPPNLTPLTELPQNGFVELTVFLKEVAGINLPDNEKNRSLVAGRLRSILAERGLQDYEEYLSLLRSNAGTCLRQEFICALTTNTTEFFRESKHFDLLRKELPAVLARLKKQGSSEIRVWCAAASTGQEPYTLLMTVLESLPAGEHWTVKFLATDIDVEVLQRASEGVYSPAELRGVAPLLLQKYFDPVASRPGFHAVKKMYRAMVRFAPLNLLSAPYPFKHPFQVVFCRNVLIYFDRETAEGVVSRLTGSLELQGLLFLGHAESGVMRRSDVDTVAHACYRKNTTAKKP